MSNMSSDLGSDCTHSLKQKNRKRSATWQPSMTCKKPAIDKPHPLKALRFVKAGKEEIEQLAKPYVARSVRTFKYWLEEHNREEAVKVLEDSLETVDS